MRHTIDNIEIKEPPIRELNKNRSCLKRSCTTGCLLLLVLLICFWLFVRFAATPREKELKDIPEIVPADIPVYDEDNVRRISYVSAREKRKALEAAAILPKIVVVPLYLSAEKYLPSDIRNAFDDGSDKKGWDQFVALVKQPIFAKIDTVTLDWFPLSARPYFIADFYTKELEKADYTVTQETPTDTTIRVTFTKDNVTGLLTIFDENPERGTDGLTLTISIESQE